MGSAQIGDQLFLVCGRKGEADGDLVDTILRFRSSSGTFSSQLSTRLSEKVARPSAIPVKAPSWTYSVQNDT